MAASTALNIILRGSPKTASTYGRTLRVRPGDDGVDCSTASQDDGRGSFTGSFAGTTA
jgi:hypothetical protein